jgi:hypothetical protein
MPPFECARCGGNASVAVTAVRSTRSQQSPPAARHYCRDCASLLGVPLPHRHDTSRDIVEPALPTWADVEIYLVHCENTLRASPEQRDTIFALAANMMEFCDHIPEPMPAKVRASFARLGVTTSSEAE